MEDEHILMEIFRVSIGWLLFIAIMFVLVACFMTYCSASSSIVELLGI
jgi:hypothetical protein